MSMNFTHSTKKRRQRGVTLVELMVSLVLGLVLTAGIIQVFVGNRTTYAFNDGLSRIQENARFSLDHIAYSVRMAGYSGCLSEVALHNNLKAELPFRDDIVNGIQGFDANGTGTGEEFVAGSSDPAPSTNENNWTPALPTPHLDNLVIPGSDVLVVRGVAGSARPLLTPFSSPNELNTDSSHDFMKGEILVVSDCQKASIFQLTDITGAGTAVKLVHGDAAGFSPGNDSDTWPPEQEYGLGSEVARLDWYAFYVGRGADGPALFQLRLRRTSDTESEFESDELVSGIETMQVRYGLDADSDGAIEEMVPADEVGDWSFVSSVEISLLARATEEYGTDTDVTSYRLGGTTRFVPVEDRRFRQVFSTTIGVRNRLP
ncbi:MAG TPA: PilW family protein [Woeseiaceae bacterium]|nr:PilW family protein [Woeseiaceae bacterium]